METGTFTSSDGTSIAFERSGSGSPVILVDGALCYRDSGPSRPLARKLEEHFTVYTYDRRGRGASGDSPPYAVEREIEDLEALVKEAGGSACVYGISSGAALALEAARGGVAIDRLALYEAPFVVDGSRLPILDDYVSRMEQLAATDRGGAVRHFMRRGVGLPAPMVWMMGLMPGWSKAKGVAHTLPYDTALTAAYQGGQPLPAGRWASVGMPTLVATGSKSPDWMQSGMKALAEVLPAARHHTLEGQTHLVKPEALAPVLTRFFAGD